GANDGRNQSVNKNRLRDERSAWRSLTAKRRQFYAFERRMIPNAILTGTCGCLPRHLAGVHVVGGHAAIWRLDERQPLWTGRRWRMCRMNAGRPDLSIRDVR